MNPNDAEFAGGHSDRGRLEIGDHYRFHGGRVTVMKTSDRIPSDKVNVMDDSGSVTTVGVRSLEEMPSMNPSDAGHRPTLKPERANRIPSAPRADGWAAALEADRVAIEKEVSDQIDREVRTAALNAAAILMAGPTAHEEHVIELARRFEGYLRNG